MVDALAKLRKFARSRKVKVYLRSKIPLGNLYLNGSYNIPNRIATVSAGLGRRNRSLLIYALAHELGHSVDFDRMREKHRYRMMQCVGVFVMWCCGELELSKKTLRKLRKIILGIEKRAYDEGDKILKKLKISLSPELMRRDRRKGLESYRQTFSPYLD